MVLERVVNTCYRKGGPRPLSNLQLRNCGHCKGTFWLGGARGESFAKSRCCRIGGATPWSWWGSVGGGALAPQGVGRSWKPRFEERGRDKKVIVGRHHLRTGRGTIRLRGGAGGEEGRSGLWESPSYSRKEYQLRNLEERKVREGTEEGGGEWELRIAWWRAGWRPLHRLGGPERSLRQRSWIRRLWRKWTRRPVVRCALQPSLSHLLRGRERWRRKRGGRSRSSALRRRKQSLRLGDCHVEVVGKGPPWRGLKKSRSPPRWGKNRGKKKFRETRTWEDWGGTTSMPPKGGVRARPAARLGRGLRRPAAAPGGVQQGPHDFGVFLALIGWLRDWQCSQAFTGINLRSGWVALFALHRKS